MHILVLNSGSSSIKFSFFESEGEMLTSHFEGEISGIGRKEASFSFRDADGNHLVPETEVKNAHIASIENAIEFVGRVLLSPEMPEIHAIGYRAVHPGPLLRGHQRITDRVMSDLRAAVEFAPLHDPAVIKLIESIRQRFPHAEHYICFDTVFHETMPPEATTYPLPKIYAEQGVKRYGFHGLSCESIVAQLREADIPFPQRMAIAHLGAGCSVTALLDGRSIDNSMGLTPTGGVVMATRPGDLDPGLMLYLIRQGKSASDVEQMVNHDAGLKALSETSGDMREIRGQASQRDTQAKLALSIFTRSIRKTIGSYLTLLGGLDAIVFAGGIGEHDAASRAEILSGLESLGIILDPDRNAISGKGLRRLSTDTSSTAIYVVPAEEDRMIARHVLQFSQVKT